ncbi:MAG: GHKL domain-containing protein [Lachnospiraceae bacterium]|nr:GHKL domain-containing protein [Lachnospiraceae bacterium]
MSIKKENVLVVIFSIALIIQGIYYGFFVYQSMNKDHSRIFIGLIVLSILIVICYLLIIFYMKRIMKQKEEQLAIHNELMTTWLKENYEKQVLNKEEEIAQIKQHLLNEIESLEDSLHTDFEHRSEKTKQFCDKFQSELKDLTMDFYSYDRILNTILLLKKKEAKQEGVSLDIHVDEIDFFPMKNIDKCSVLMNVLDNAIDAAKMVEDDPKVYVKIGKKGDYIVTKVTNSSKELIKRDEKGTPVTTKNNEKLHGRGIKNIQSIVEKYQGYFELKEKENQVIATIFVPDMTDVGEEM